MTPSAVWARRRKEKGVQEKTKMSGIVRKLRTG